MSKGQQPPAAPDPSVVARQQTGSNINSGTASAILSNPNVVGPTGSTTFNQTGSFDVGGQQVPQFTQTTQYNPLIQSLLTGTENLGVNSLLPTATTLAGQTGAATKPLDFNSPNNSFVEQGPTLVNQAGANAAYGVSKGFLDPQWTQNQKDLEDQLSRQGISQGDPAYETAMTNFNNAKTQAYNAAQGGAVTQGAQIANNAFGMALQGQNQNVQQQVLAQQNPIQLLSQLYGTGAVA